MPKKISHESGETKKSKIWDYFQIDNDDKSITICKICKAKISRGGINYKYINDYSTVKY